MTILKTVIGNRCTTLTKWLPVILGEARPCFSTATSKHFGHRLNKFLPSSECLKPVVPIACLNYQTNSSNSTVDRTYCTSVPSANDKGFLVYEGKVKTMFRNVKIFSLSTSVVGLACQPYLWYTVQDMSLLIAGPLFTAVNFFVFANPIMIHYLAKRYVNELHYNPQTQTFTATVLSFFARRKSFAFTPEDVVVPDIPGMFSMLTAKGHPLFVDHRDFTSVEVYKKMMGFDKPLDLTQVSSSSEKND